MVLKDQLNNQTQVENTLNPLEKVGALIKKAREEKSLSIKDVAGSLKIGEEQLSALEKGEEDLLPEKVFIKAMIRRVAERLQIDEDTLIEEFQAKPVATFSSSTKTEKKTDNSITESNKIKLLPTWIIFIGAISITTSFLGKSYIERKTSSPTTQSPISYKKFKSQKDITNSNFHIVLPGQTLTKISAHYNIPINDLIRINKISNPSELKIGSKLIVKTDKVDGI